jgi:tyrosine-protein kinase
VRRRAPSAGVTGALAPDEVQREAMRVLRSNLQVALSDLQNPIVIVTSPNAGEGKTSTCVPLAQSLAETGTRVVLVDLDLRHPDAHRLLDRPNGLGVVDILRGRTTVEEALQFVPVERHSGLYFLSTGSSVGNPTELLGTGRTITLLNALAQQADIVLIDTAPVLPVADTLVVGRFAAGAIMVIEARGTPVPAINRAKDALTRNQTRILGLVVNRLKSQDAAYSYGYYGYGETRPNGEEPITQ